MKAACSVALMPPRAGLWACEFQRPNRARSLMQPEFELVQTKLSTDMGPDSRPSSDRKRSSSQAHNAASCACDKRGLTARSSQSKASGIPAILQVGFYASPDGIVVQLEKLCDPSAGFPHRRAAGMALPTGNIVVFRADGARKASSLDAVC